jgi:hypothetical protein
MHDAGSLRHQMGAQQIAAEVGRQERAYQPALAVDPNDREWRETGGADVEQQAPLQRHQHAIAGQQHEQQRDVARAQVADLRQHVVDIEQQQAARERARSQDPAEPSLDARRALGAQLRPRRDVRYRGLIVRHAPPDEPLGPPARRKPPNTLAPKNLQDQSRATSRPAERGPSSSRHTMVRLPALRPDRSRLIDQARLGCQGAPTCHIEGHGAWKQARGRA